jgi:Ca-activated chloride channel family protein
MSELTSIHNFAFGAPEWLVTLVVVPLLLAFAAVVRRRRSPYTVLFTNLRMLASVAALRRTRWRRRVPLIALALALTITAAALARPHVNLTVQDNSATVILVVDVSGSMAASDVTPSRIDAAIAAMHAFLAKLPKNDKVGLVTFSDKVQVVATPTTDHNAVGGALDLLAPQTGTALGDGIVAAVKLAVSSLTASGTPPVKPGQYLPAAIVLESDGAQNRGTATPQQAANLAKAAGIRVYGVALGTRYGMVTEGNGILGQSIPVPPDPGIVSLLGRVSGGQAFSATTAASLNTIYRHLGESVGRRDQTREITSWFEVAAGLILGLGIGAARAWGAPLP